MHLLRDRDIVLNYANTRLRAWSEVVAGAVPSARPDPEADQAWSDNGYRVAVQYHEIVPPVALADIPIDWRVSEGGPFNSDGGPRQGYLFQISDRFASQLRQQFSQLDFPPPTRAAPLELAAEAVRPPPAVSIGSAGGGNCAASGLSARSAAAGGDR